MQTDKAGDEVGAGNKAAVTPSQVPNIIRVTASELASEHHCLKYRICSHAEEIHAIFRPKKQRGTLQNLQTVSSAR